MEQATAAPTKRTAAAVAGCVGPETCRQPTRTRRRRTGVRSRGSPLRLVRTSDPLRWPGGSPRTGPVDPPRRVLRLTVAGHWRRGSPGRQHRPGRGRLVDLRGHYSNFLEDLQALCRDCEPLRGAFRAAERGTVARRPLCSLGLDRHALLKERSAATSPKRSSFSLGASTLRERWPRGNGFR